MTSEKQNKELERLQSIANGLFAACKEKDLEIEVLKTEIKYLKSLVVMRFDHDYPPRFQQGYVEHECLEPVTAKYCEMLRDEISKLALDLVD